MPEHIDLSNFSGLFVEETKKLLEKIKQELSVCIQDPTNQQSLKELLRLFHTIKGSAGLMGYTNISSTAQELEKTYKEIEQNIQTFTQETYQKSHEAIENIQAATNALL